MKNEFVIGFDAGMKIASIGKLSLLVDAMQAVSHLCDNARMLHGVRTALSCRLANY